MSFLLLWSLRASGVLMLGLGLAFLLRRRSAALRCLVLRAALVAAWGVPLVGLVTPRLGPGLPAPLAPSLASFASPQEIPMNAPRTVTPSSGSSDSKPPLNGLYALVSGGLVFRWLAAHARLRRAVRRTTPDAKGFYWVADTALGVPATYGRTVMLPAASAAWPEARLRAAVLHELAHVRRGDWAWQTAAELFAALHWANPAAWLLGRALRDAAEAATDDEVLARGMSPSAYARELLAVATGGRRVGAAMAMARRGGVADRVAAILSARRDRTRPSRRLTALVAGGFLLATLGVAGMGKRADGKVETHVALVVDPATGRAWTPDGQPAPLDAVTLRKLWESHRPYRAWAGRRPVLVAVDVVGETSARPVVSLYTPFIAGEELWQAREDRPTEGGRPVVRRWFPLAVPPGATTVDGRLFLSVAPWRDDRALMRGKAPGQATLTDIGRVKPTETLYFVKAHVHLPKNRDRQYQLVPVGPSGRSYEPIGWEGSGERDGDAGFMVTARTTNPAVDHWLLRSRANETRTVRGIRLKPTETKP